MRRTPGLLWEGHLILLCEKTSWTSVKRPSALLWKDPLAFYEMLTWSSVKTKTSWSSVVRPSALLWEDSQSCRKTSWSSVRRFILWDHLNFYEIAFFSMKIPQSFPWEAPRGFQEKEWLIQETSRSSIKKPYWSSIENFWRGDPLVRRPIDCEKTSWCSARYLPFRLRKNLFIFRKILWSLAIGPPHLQWKNLLLS